MRGKLLWCLLSGLSLGLLVGLSATPVLQGVLTCVLGLTGAAVGALSGIPHATSADEDLTFQERVAFALAAAPAPVALLAFGLALGAMAGIVIRTHDLLGVSPAAERALYQDYDVSRPVDEAILHSRLGTAAPGIGAARSTALFATGSENCTRWRNLTPPELRNEWAADSRLKPLSDALPDGAVLPLRDAMCPP